MRSTVSPTALTVTPASLLDAFAQVPNPRRAASVRYPLVAMLAKTVAAILSGRPSVLAISERITRQPATMRTSLEFSGEQTPRQSIVQRLFTKLDGQALSQVLRAVVALVADTGDAPLTRVTIDGKAQTGPLGVWHAGCPVHAVSAICQQTGVVLAQHPVDGVGQPIARRPNRP